jgi:7,8-dihydropterin-6-yl-methyl-4-(beta-D-ribofuranosyl)aminobenzene 5'-phosphate synthase
MKMLRITILCDNVLGVPFGIGEHGFSALVEGGEEPLLFDVGSGKGIIANALTFGKDLRAVRKICLSHGHYDHTEGLPQVLAITGGAEIYAHPGIFQERYGQRPTGNGTIRRFVGIPFRREYLECLGANFRLDAGFREVAKGIYLTGEVPRVTSFEKGDPKLLTPMGGTLVQDHILDDQSLVIRTAGGLVVVCGCAHSGMINTLRYAREKTGDHRIQAVLGGTHLGFLTDELMETSIAELKGMNPQRVAISHCTGMKAACRLMQLFGERFAFAHVGSCFEFE